MLPQALSWHPSGDAVVYSSLSGDEHRTAYLYDNRSGVSSKLRLPAHDWFEFQFIHPEQILIHLWKQGIYLYDIVRQKSQKLVDADDSRFFEMNTQTKQMVYHNRDDTYLFNPKRKQSQRLVTDATELIIDPVHHSFIAVNTKPVEVLNIFYKNEVIYTDAGGFNLCVTSDYSTLIYAIEDSELDRTRLRRIDLKTLIAYGDIEFDGVIQTSNHVDGTLHLNVMSGTTYTMINVDIERLVTETVYRVQNDHLVFSQLSPDKQYLGLVTDSETGTRFDRIRLDKKSD